MGELSGLPKHFRLVIPFMSGKFHSLDVIQVLLMYLSTKIIMESFSISLFVVALHNGDLSEQLLMSLNLFPIFISLEMSV